VVQGLYPLWERTPDAPVVTGLRTDRPEILLTTVLDAEPDAKHTHPGPTIWPLVAALAIGVTFIVGIFTPWGFVIGPALMLPALVAWGWPRHVPAHERGFEDEPA
jgi:cytochrome c oxidase subunit 1